VASAEPKHVQAISKIFGESYGWNCGLPYVYSAGELREEVESTAGEDRGPPVN
jgi:hypothetical protein